MELFYRLLADLTVIFHFAYVLFVVLGLVAIVLGGALKWSWVCNRWFRGIHLAMILVVVLEAWIGMTCPLTSWENLLRAKGGQESYGGDFIATWLHEVLFFEADSWVFTLCYTAFGAAVLAALYFVPPRWKSFPSTRST